MRVTYDLKCKGGERNEQRRKTGRFLGLALGSRLKLDILALHRDHRRKNGIKSIFHRSYDTI